VDTLYERDTDWNKDDLMQRINNGLHVINHLGHANLQEVMKMSYWHVDDLTNSMYFLGYSQGCYAGSFDNRHSDGNIMNFDCVVEHFVVDNNASIGNPVGAFAFIANSRYGWGVKGSTNGASQRFDRQFWDAIFGEGINNLGKANQDSKEDNAGNINSDAIRWCYYELNLFGCPETPFGVVGPIGISVDGLEFYYTKDEEPDLDIPDGTSPWWEDDPTDPGEVRSYINIGSPIVETVDVFVDITHTWRGDISLDLISPAGNTYTLKTRDIYDDDEDIFATYTIGTTYQGEDARGTWTLWVRDWWVEMTGTLNLWRMKITSKTLSFGQLGAGDIIQSSSTTRFKVTNIGTQVEDFTLSLTNPSGWTAGDTAGDEVYVLKGLFVGNGDTPSSTHFASDDVITTSVQSATASRFGDAGMSANGHNVPANNSRYLWFQFQAPTATSITSEQAITVTIGAQAP
jgi:subtilisin-like proprotein convertase family protein